VDSTRSHRRHEADLFRRAIANELTAEELSWLVPAATHPAHAEVGTLARANGLEYAEAVWHLPFPRTMTALSVPMLPARSTAGVTHARRARIAMMLSRGDTTEAEVAARELLSAGVLLIEHSFLLLDNVIGQQLVRSSSRMLEQIMEVTGQEDRLAAFRENMETARLIAHVAQLGAADARGDRLAFMQAQRNIVADPDALHGLQWEFFLSYNTASSCLNLNRLVYGAGDQHDKWLADSHDTLVRTQGEEHLFKLARHGFFGTAEGWPVTWRGRLMSLGLLGGGGIARCMSLLDVR
jgi:hypothetical protein